MKTLRGQAGFSVIENIVAMGLLVFVSFTFISGLMAMKQLSQTSLVSNSSEREVNEIIENVRAGLDTYQVNFEKTGEARAEALENQPLTMAWDIGIQTTAAACPGCGGRYGFVIQPFEGTGLQGLYLVTLRMTHVKWSEPRTYQFVVTTK